MADLPFFYSPEINTTGIAFELDEATARHCVQVLRMKPGEQLHLTNGKGLLAKAVIHVTGKKTCSVQVHRSETAPPPECKNIIAISLLKNTGRFEWFLEKAGELGITEIIPLQCKRTEKQQFRYDRMQQILVSAMLQSKQTHLTQLHPPVTYNNALAMHREAQRYIAHCYPDERKKIFDVTGHQKAKTQVIFIGPEGDFTEQEIEMAMEMNIMPVSLGNTRLRTETAGVKAAILLTL
jgi:16S rRNA (uracil1498-N3)-methyltransferase